jgi:thiol-disulfide isomerase/thioredoxin
MRRTLCTLLFVLLAAPAGAAGDDALGGYPLRDLGGNEFALGDLTGQVVVVNFWATWCKPCRQELPELNRWQREMQDVRFVAISIDRDAEKARRLVDSEQLGMTVCIDGPDGLARQLDLDFLPCTIVLGPDGQTRLVTPGVTPERMAELNRTIRDLRPAATAAGMEVGR